MGLLRMVAPSEILLLKVLALGIFFGWNGRRLLKPKTRMIENVKFHLKGDL